MAGLLGDFDLEGLLKDPLFRIGTNLMAAGGPQSKPHSFGQDLQTALNQYQQQTDADLQRQMLAQQMKALEKKTAMQEKADAASEAIMKMIMGAGIPSETMPQTAMTPSGPVAPVTPSVGGNAKWRENMPKEWAPYFQNAVKGLKHADKITPDLLQSIAETEAAKGPDGKWDPLSVGPPITKEGNQTAKGLMQFTDTTFASEFPNDDPANRMNPELAPRYAARYLDRLIDRTGSLENALRVYGGGMNKPVTKQYAATILGRLQEQAAAGVPLPAEGPSAPPAPPVPASMPTGASGAPTPLAPPMPAPAASGAQAQPGPQMVPPPVAAPAPMPATPTYQPPVPAPAPVPAPMPTPALQAPPARPINEAFWGPFLSRKSPMEKAYIAATLAQSSDPIKRQLGEGMQAVVTQELKQQAEDANAVPLAGAKAGAEAAAKFPFEAAIEIEKANRGIEVEQAKQDQAQYAKAIEATDKGRQQLSKLDFLEATLDGVRTGALADVRNNVQKVLLAFGIDDPAMMEEVAKSGASKTVMNALILAGRDPANGGGMPGAMSDNDLRFLKDMVANYEQTPEANALIIRHLKRIAQRQIAMGQQADVYAMKNNGRLGPEFRLEMRGWEAKQTAADSAEARQDLLRLQGKWNLPKQMMSNQKIWMSPTGKRFLMEKTSNGKWKFFGTDVMEPPE